MSRTYRRKKVKCDNYFMRGSADDLSEINFDEVETITMMPYRWIGGRVYYNYTYKKTSKKGKKALARWHSESCKSYGEPGPMWYIHETAQVPYRVRAKTELSKYKKDFDYEVILESKPHREYWT